MSAELIDLLRKLLTTKSSAMHMVALLEYCYAAGIDPTGPDLQELLALARGLAEKKASSSSVGGKTSKRSKRKEVFRAISTNQEPKTETKDITLRIVMPHEDTLRFPVRCTKCNDQIVPKRDPRGYERINGEHRNYHSFCLPSEIESTFDAIP
jgi:hypothetical protein